MLVTPTAHPGSPTIGMAGCTTHGSVDAGTGMGSTTVSTRRNRSIGGRIPNDWCGRSVL